MTMHLVRRNARSMPCVGEETLAPIRRQSSIDHVVGPRMSKSSSPSKDPDSRILRGYCGPKDLGTPAHLISSPRPMPRRKKCSRSNEGNPDYQDILPMMTLSSADQNHRRGRHHITRSSPLEDPKGDFEPNGLAIRAW